MVLILETLLEILLFPWVCHLELRHRLRCCCEVSVYVDVDVGHFVRLLFFGILLFSFSLLTSFWLRLLLIL
jgi:hypothetical protein